MGKLNGHSAKMFFHVLPRSTEAREVQPCWPVCLPEPTQRWSEDTGFAPGTVRFHSYTKSFTGAVIRMQCAMPQCSFNEFFHPRF